MGLEAGRPAPDQEQRAEIVGDDTEEPAPDRTAPAAGPEADLAEAPLPVLGPDPDGGRAKIEIDFRSVPQDAWFGCEAKVEGLGIEGSRVALTDKPYRGGRVLFDLPAGRWRVTWRASTNEAAACGRVVRLLRDEHVLIQSGDPGDERQSWIWPGLGLLDITVLAPSGRPLPGAPVVVRNPNLSDSASWVRAGTDHQGRCRVEVVPGRHELRVRWKLVEVTARAGQVTPVRIGGEQEGSLIVSSEKPAATRIRRVGTEPWCGPDPGTGAAGTSDEMRFDFLPPGEYEVAVEDGEKAVGTVVVQSGLEALFRAVPDR